MNIQKKFKLLLNDYLKSDDEKYLLELLDKNPELIGIEYSEYPDFHRIIDIQLGSKKYRVCRQISQNENLILIEIDELMDQLGVPLWLEGEKLRTWANSFDDTSEPVNWDSYK
ncbi:MAG: hypothetical protein L3J51_05810 [Cocleimonas sp.]|nr:hypothetical protein [Cocleimonas sp.]